MEIKNLIKAFVNFEKLLVYIYMYKKCGKSLHSRQIFQKQDIAKTKVSSSRIVKTFYITSGPTT